MKFLEKHIHGFFILNLGLSLLMLLYFIIGTYQLAGWPNDYATIFL